ncbi:MAG TPA: tetratricopeptide repeat protein [Candidatus Obscuribacterales bacterium]
MQKVRANCRYRPMAMIVACLLLSWMLLSWVLPTRAADNVVLKPKSQQQFLAAELLVQGSNLLKAKQAFKARPILEQAAALWPEEPQVHFNLGVCMTQVGEFPKAIEEFQQAMKGNPSLTECLPDIASCYQLMNDYNSAISYFQEYLRRQPQAADAPQVKGMINALEKAASKQVMSDPQGEDYFPSVLRNGRAERWQLNRLPLKVFISNGTDERGAFVDGFQPYFNDILLQCFDIWMRAADHKLGYVLVDDARQADIVCTWTNHRDFLSDQTAVEQGAARVATRPLPQPGLSQIIGARVIILIVNPTTGKAISDDEIKKTCLHELGHAMGLSGHSNNNKDVMFYSESPTVWAALTKRDKNTITRLYADYPPVFADRQPASY